jgi:hypothetical protein
MDRPHREARRNETLTAVKHGGRVTPGSGSGGFDKNDVTNDDWSFEVKTTTQKGYRLTLDTFRTTEKNALEQGKRPAMVIAFVPVSGRTKRLVILDEDDFTEMIEHGTQAQTGGPGLETS